MNTPRSGARLVAIVGAIVLSGCGAGSSEDFDVSEGELGSASRGPERGAPNGDAARGQNDSTIALDETEPKVVLPFTWQGQPNGYWCGPGAVRIALTTRMEEPPSQDVLARYMGTTTNGTDHIGLPVQALNRWLTPDVLYESRTMGNPPTQAERDLLKKDVIARISSGHPIVANVVSGWRPPNYPSGIIYHYVAVVGYDKLGELVLVADPAALGSAGPKWKDVPPTYWISIRNLGTWIGGKGYSG